MASQLGSAEHVVRTYRYLRVSLVGIALLLAVSVGLEVMRSGELLGSISEYYYTPGRGIFVGVMFAAALCLIAIKGRGLEDVLLNAAGMLAPLVAVVPAPKPPTLVSGDARVIPADVAANIENNVSALVALAVAGLAFATWTAFGRRDPDRRQALRELALAGLLVAVLGGWFVIHESSFFEYAHYVAAIAMFGCFAVVAFLNAGLTQQHSVIANVPAMTTRRRSMLYRAIAIAMGLAIVVAVVFALLTAGNGSGDEHWLFWVETVLLALFASFWSLQTIEYWNDGLPAGG